MREPNQLISKLITNLHAQRKVNITTLCDIHERTSSISTSFQTRLVQTNNGQNANVFHPIAQKRNIKQENSAKFLLDRNIRKKCCLEYVFSSKIRTICIIYLAILKTISLLFCVQEKIR